MCLAVPGRVLEITERDGTLMARVDFGGVTKEVCLEYVPDLQVGEYTIVHVGFALQRLDEQSALEESFADGLLDCPQYTRPETYRDEKVPDVLLSGHHENIRRWRLKQALGRTWARRPDLLAARDLSEEERVLLEEFRQESGAKP